MEKRLKVSKKVRDARLRWVAEYIQTYPETFDQQVFCGTPCCIAGHLVAAFGTEEERTYQQEPYEASFVTVLHTAVRLLGLGKEQEHIFQSARTWPQPFKTDYLAAQKGSLKRAQVAAARIEHFIQTGE